MIDEHAKRRIAERMAAAHPVHMSPRDRQELADKLRRIAETLFAEEAEVLRSASDLIVCQIVERNDVLKALRIS